MSEFLQRLKERKLVQWAAAYVAAALRSDTRRSGVRWVSVM
jgi:hypothetical protein